MSEEEFSDSEECDFDDDDEEEEMLPPTQPDGQLESNAMQYVNGYYQEAYGKLQAQQPQQEIAIRDWNEEFQSILSEIGHCKEEEKLCKYNELSRLAHGLPSPLSLPFPGLNC